jgi:predicted O-methyltransferase YrrM
MDLEQLLIELEKFGAENDHRYEERSRRMLNITRQAGQLLEVLVKASAAQRILEVGTSNGYSTLWLARGAWATGGKVTTMERSEDKISLARVNFERGGVNEIIRQVQGNAGELIAQEEANSFDFIFLDATRSEYPGWLADLKRILRPGGMLVLDNATSHASELALFTALLENDPSFTTCLVTVGKGEYLAVKSPRR